MHAKYHASDAAPVDNRPHPAPDPGKLSLDMDYPSLKAKQMLAILTKEPLAYRVARQSGSHRTLESPEWPRLVFAFHDKATIPPGLVRSLLEKKVGLTPDQAAEILGL